MLILTCSREVRAEKPMANRHARKSHHGYFAGHSRGIDLPDLITSKPQAHEEEHINRHEQI